MTWLKRLRLDLGGTILAIAATNTFLGHQSYTVQACVGVVGFVLADIYLTRSEQC